jgi:hypothetical protein
MGDQQPAFACIPAKGYGADAYGFPDPKAQSAANTKDFTAPIVAE